MSFSIIAMVALHFYNANLVDAETTYIRLLMRCPPIWLSHTVPCEVCKNI